MDFTERQRSIAERVRAEAPGEIRRIDPATGGVHVAYRPPAGSTPSLFHVSLEPSIDGSETLHWQFIGPIDGGEPDDNRAGSS